MYNNTDTHILYWSGKPNGARRAAGIGFAIKRDIVAKLTEMPHPVSDRIMTMKIPLTKNRNDNNNNNNNNCLKSNIQCIEIRVQWTVHLGSSHMHVHAVTRVHAVTPKLVICVMYLTSI